MLIPFIHTPFFWESISIIIFIWEKQTSKQKQQETFIWVHAPFIRVEKTKRDEFKSANFSDDNVHY